MEELSIIIRTADKSRKAEIGISPSHKVSDIIEGAIYNWALPKDNDYTIINATSNKVLNPSDTLQYSEIRNGDILEIQPVLTAGRR